MSAGSGAADTGARSTADAVARRSYGKLVAFLAARTRDMAAAEDALSEALIRGRFPDRGLIEVYVEQDRLEFRAAVETTPS